MIRFVCAKVGKKWPDVWVYRLLAMLEATCSEPFEFYCISEEPVPGVTTLPLSRELIWTDKHASQLRDSYALQMNETKPQGCWAKLDAFLMEGDDPVVCLDLDVCIVGDPADLVRKDLHMAPGPNGSVYSFTPSALSAKLYPEKIPFSTRLRGEQEWVAETHGNVQPLKGCYSFKRHLSPNKPNLPHDAIVVFFHGVPTPAAESVQHLPYVRRSWEGFQRVDRQSG